MLNYGINCVHNHYHFSNKKNIKINKYNSKKKNIKIYKKHNNIVTTVSFTTGDIIDIKRNMRERTFYKKKNQKFNFNTLAQNNIKFLVINARLINEPQYFNNILYKLYKTSPSVLISINHETVHPSNQNIAQLRKQVKSFIKICNR